MSRGITFFTASLLTALSCFPLASNAQFLQLPAIFEVTGVADDDTLNIRSEPSSSSRDIGDLYPYELVEVMAYDVSEKWARVIAGERNGWVSRRYLVAFDEQEQVHNLLDVINFSCFGTEPYWSVYIPVESDEYVMGIMENPGQEIYNWLEYESRIASQNTFNSTFAFQGSDAKHSEETYTAILRRAECSDGMSDRTYGWSLELLDYYRGVLGSARSGCCTMASIEESRGG